MEIFETISVPFIVASVYVFVEALKAISKNSKFNNFIPVISVILGAAIGVLIYCGFPQAIVAENVYQAVLIGAASGWAATGANQTYKKIKEMNNGGEKGGS
jgi:hypothetical protein